MSTLQFNEAPLEANNHVSNEPDKTTDNPMASTAKGKGLHTSWVHWFNFDPSLTQAMTVTPGTQDSDVGLAPKVNDKNKGSTVGNESGRTGTQDQPNKH